MAEETKSTSTQTFLSAFESQRIDIDGKLLANEQSSPSRGNATTRGASTQELQTSLSQLRKSLLDANVAGFLPAYERGRCESQLKDLEARFDLSKAKKGKGFGFKKKGVENAPKPAVPLPPSKPPLSDSQKQTEAIGSPAGPLYEDHAMLQDKEGVYLGWSDVKSSNPEKRTQQSLTISSLTKCVVDLTYKVTPPLEVPPVSATNAPPELTAVHCWAVKDCVIVLGEVQGSVMIHDAERCVIVIVCHQLRIHTSHRTNIFARCQSAPIIEKCSRLGFGAFPAGLTFGQPTSRDLTKKEAITPESVVDFSHLRSNSASPNWRGLPQEDGEKLSQVWTELQAQIGEGQGVVDRSLESLWTLLPEVDEES